MLATFLGTDAVSFTVGTEYPGLPPRNYTSLQQAVDEVGDSRVWGGIHFRQSVDKGSALGAAVADAIVKGWEGAAFVPKDGAGSERGCEGRCWAALGPAAGYVYYISTLQCVYNVLALRVLNLLPFDNNTLQSKARIAPLSLRLNQVWSCIPTNNTNFSIHNILMHIHHNTTPGALLYVSGAALSISAGSHVFSA